MIRSLDECGPKWKEIIEKNPGDVYGHFWDISDRSNDNDTVDKFVELFNPKKIEIENFESFKESTIDIMMKNIIIPSDLWLAIQDSIRGGRFISFHYKIWKANQLSLKQDYDIIVRCRTDHYPDTNIKLELKQELFRQHSVDDDANFSRFLIEIQQQDRLKNISIKDYLPEFYELIKESI